MDTRIPLSPPVIKSINEDVVRPLWSVMIPVYNCAEYLQSTLESVLSQAPDEDKMQIEVIDDCSIDADVEAIVMQVGKGRVLFKRQEVNVGSLRNFETCINRAQGILIHILHGDDQVLPGFYNEMENLFDQYPAIGAAITGLSACNEEGSILYSNNCIQQNAGIIEDWLEKIAAKQRLQTCAIVVKRSVYEDVGGFFAVHYGEDWEMWVRIASKYPVAYSPKDLALYRIHANNISTRSSITGQNIKNISTVINIIQKYLPSEKRKSLKKAAKTHFAMFFANSAQGIYTNGNHTIALRQAYAALQLDINKTTIISMLKICIKILLRYNKPAK